MKPGALNNKSAVQAEVGEQCKKIRLEEIYPAMQDVLNSGGTCSFTITGSSMVPFLSGGRDQVTLFPVPDQLKKNDLPLYRRQSGQFVLHRIVKVCKDGTYTCCGDHQWFLEKGIEKSQMLCVARSYVRKGRKFSDRNVFYRVYRTIWTWIIPLRPYLFALRERFCRHRNREDKRQS